MSLSILDNFLPFKWYSIPHSYNLKKKRTSAIHRPLSLYHHFDLPEDDKLRSFMKVLVLK